MTPTTKTRLGIAAVIALFLALSAQAARESGGSDIETMERTAQSVEDTDAAGRQVEAEHMFNQRVQLAGDTICIRTHGPSYRASWEGKDESLHCVQRGEPAKQDRLMLADGGVR
ncbi:hypothetical protein [Curvibacter lanceolatus]|uniref:hypothetical protein n=1 Tax=Curvibacter lanceolatus TaxID=86182 RepID=UPI00037F744E|nr:hypothetical protein [Curvibacter lanceolatus]